MSACKHMRQLPLQAVTHSYNAITLSAELLALSSDQKRKRIWLLTSPPLGLASTIVILELCSVGSTHGPLFAPALCTQLLTDSDKESELGKKKKRALFVARAWMASAHRESITISPMSQCIDFQEKWERKCPPFPLVFFTFCQPDSFIPWMNNNESSEAVMFGRQPRKKLPSFLLLSL